MTDLPPDARARLGLPPLPEKTRRYEVAKANGILAHYEVTPMTMQMNLDEGDIITHEEDVEDNTSLEQFISKRLKQLGIEPPPALALRAQGLQVVDPGGVDATGKFKRPVYDKPTTPSVLIQDLKKWEDMTQQEQSKLTKDLQDKVQQMRDVVASIRSKAMNK